MYINSVLFKIIVVVSTALSYPFLALWCLVSFFFFVLTVIDGPKKTSSA